MAYIHSLIKPYRRCEVTTHRWRPSPTSSPRSESGEAGRGRTARPTAEKRASLVSPEGSGSCSPCFLRPNQTLQRARPVVPELTLVKQGTAAAHPSRRQDLGPRSCEARAGSPQLPPIHVHHRQQQGWMGSPVTPESSHPSQGGDGIDVGGGYQQQQVFVAWAY